MRDISKVYWCDRGLARNQIHHYLDILPKKRTHKILEIFMKVLGNANASGITSWKFLCPKALTLDK